MVSAPRVGTQRSESPKTAKHGLSWTYLRIEIKRQISRPAILFFCIAMPIGFYILFASAFGGVMTDDSYGSANAVFMLSMAVYGVALAAGEATVSVAHERPVGWNRQLRLTPLRPWAYAITKTLSAMIISGLSLAILYTVGLIWGVAEVSPSWWVISAIFIWVVGSITFAAMGLVIALAFRGETGTAILVPVILVSAFVAGVFQIPVNSDVYDLVRQFVPMYGLDQIALAPVWSQDATWAAWANAVAWMVAMCTAAVILFRRDTARQ